MRNRNRQIAVGLVILACLIAGVASYFALRTHPDTDPESAATKIDSTLVHEYTVSAEFVFNHTDPHSHCGGRKAAPFTLQGHTIGLSYDLNPVTESFASDDGVCVVAYKADGVSDPGPYKITNGSHEIPCVWQSQTIAKCSL